jgi:hypothetical protein
MWSTSDTHTIVMTHCCHIIIVRVIIHSSLFFHLPLLSPIYNDLHRREREWVKNSVAWVRERTIPTERPPLAGEVSVNFCGWGCHVVSVTDPYVRILGFLDRSRYFFFQVAPRLYWVDPVPDSLLLRKSGSAGREWRTWGKCLKNLKDLHDFSVP